MTHEREKEIRGKNYSFNLNPILNELWSEIDSLRSKLEIAEDEAGKLQEKWLNESWERTQLQMKLKEAEEALLGGSERDGAFWREIALLRIRGEQ